jgi:hypothetical protein
MTGALGACGSGGGSNDQGVSFTALGFFGTDDEGVCDPEVGSSGTVIPISGLVLGNNTSDALISSAFTCIGFQNNMTTQSVRTQRVNLEYYIEGAAEQPPSTQVAFGVVLGRVQVDGSSGGDTSDQLVVGSGSGIVAPNSIVAGIAIMPAEIRSWISLNRGILPEAPFVMVATATAVGITSAGNDIRSNPIDYFIEVAPDNLFNQTGGGAALDSGEAELNDDAGLASEEFESEGSNGDFVDVAVE